MSEYKGYKIAFTRKIADMKNPIHNDFFDFRVWGHFTGFFVKGISEVEDYYDQKGKLRDYCYKYQKYNNDCEQCKFKIECGNGKRFSHNFFHIEKQMLNLLRIDYSKENIDIFHTDDNKSVFVITIVNNYSESQNLQTAKRVIEDIVKNINNNGNQVEFELFQTLSIEDFVIVFKANSLSPITGCLKDLMVNENFDAVDLYSIISLDCRNTDRNKVPNTDAEKDKVCASLKMYLNPTANYRKIEDEIKKITKNIGTGIDSPKAENLSYMSYGRFDLKLIMQICKLSDLMSAFDVINPHEGSKEPFDKIISTDTTIMTDLPLSYSDKQVGSSDPDSLVNWLKIINDGNGVIKDNLTNVSELLYLLIERIHQLHHATFSHKYSGFVNEFCIRFINHVSNNYPDSITNTELIYIVKNIIENISNVFSHSFRDFEMVQKDGLYIHSSGKLLIAFKKYVNNEISIAKNLKHSITSTLIVLSEDEKKHKNQFENRQILVMSAMQYSVTNQTKRFTEGKLITNYDIITVPPEFLFDLPISLIALTHEIGHSLDYNNQLSILLYKYSTKRYVENQRAYGLFNTSEQKIMNFYAYFLNDFFADTYCFYSMGWISLTNIKHSDNIYNIYTKFIDKATPSSEVNGLHIPLRRIAIQYILLKLQYRNSDEFRTLNVSNSFQNLTNSLYKITYKNNDFDINTHSTAINSTAKNILELKNKYEKDNNKHDVAYLINLIDEEFKKQELYKPKNKKIVIFNDLLGDFTMIMHIILETYDFFEKNLLTPFNNIKQQIADNNCELKQYCESIITSYDDDDKVSDINFNILFTLLKNYVN